MTDLLDFFGNKIKIGSKVFHIKPHYKYSGYTVERGIVTDIIEENNEIKVVMDKNGDTSWTTKVAHLYVVNW